MSCAKKCDRCGIYYENAEVFSFKGKASTWVGIDLCPKCSEAFMTFMENDTEVDEDKNKTDKKVDIRSLPKENENKTDKTVDIRSLTREDLNDVPYLDWDNEKWKDMTFDSIIIVPQGDGENLHDSGFQRMAYVLLGKDEEILGKVGGGSDVIYLNGIGGFGIDGIAHPKQKPSGWTMDCLPCGYLRIWSGGESLKFRNIFDFCGSSSEIYSVEKQ